MFHHHSAGCAALAASLPAQHEFDRESSFRGSSSDPPRLRMEGQTDGKTLVSCGHVSYGKELPPSDGAQGSLALQAILDGNHEKQA